MACDQILVIEDERDLREGFRELLEMEGFRVTSAAHGAEGLERLKELVKPCLILLDLMMPVMNGWQFLDEIRNKHTSALKDVPIVVISAAADVALAKQNYGCGYLQKPVSAQELVNLAHDHCEGAGQSSLFGPAHQEASE